MDASLLQTDSLLDLMIRFGLNLGVVIVLVRFIYWGVKREKEYAFSFLLTNVLIFFLCYMMKGAQISVGFAFGLFAVFGILRYRTTTLPVKEMTYLFACISLALINGLGSQELSLLELGFINVIILLTVFVMEKLWQEEVNDFSSKKVDYERIDLIEAGDSESILKDLRNRTGLDVHDYTVKNLNLVDGRAEIRVYYKKRKDDSA